MMGLLEMSTQLPAPICAWQVPEKGEMSGLCSQRHAAWRRVCSHRSGHTGSRCGSTSAALRTTFISPIRLAASPLWAVPQCQWRRISSASSRKWRKKSYKDDGNLISQQTSNNESFCMTYHGYLSSSLFYWNLRDPGVNKCSDPLWYFVISRLMRGQKISPKPPIFTLAWSEIKPTSYCTSPANFPLAALRVLGPHISIF